MTLNSQSVSGFNYMAGIVVALVTAVSLPLGGLCNCIFLTIPFTAVLKLPIETFSFITLIQLLFIIRFLAANIHCLNYSIGIVLCGLLTQLFSMVFYNQSVSNLILLSSNLLTFYYTFLLFKDYKLNINHAYLAFSVGVILAGLIALSYGIHVAEMQDYRFCGLWTDPNFWGMFCLIGIVTCLLNGFRRPGLFVILIPMIITLAYLGFLTLSRTFVVVSLLTVLITSGTYLKKSRIGSFVVIIVLLVAVYLAWPYAEIIFSERGFDENNMTNNRFDNTIMIFDFVKEHIEVILFGWGYNNTLNVLGDNSFGHGATHNTYADLFLDFGVLNLLIAFIALIKHSYIVRKIFSHLFSLPGIVFCILLFYMGTLSMTKYVLLYLFAGAYIGTALKLQLRK